MWFGVTIWDFDGLTWLVQRPGVGSNRGGKETAAQRTQRKKGKYVVVVEGLLRSWLAQA